MERTRAMAGPSLPALLQLVRSVRIGSTMTPSPDIVPSDVRQSAITSHSIGVHDLGKLLDALPASATAKEYEAAVSRDNILGLATESGRSWRFATLRRLYLLRRDAVLFTALRDLWSFDAEGQPLLAGLCATARDTVFRATAPVIHSTRPGDHVTVADLADAIEGQYPGAYAMSTLKKTAANAYASWEQTGHLSRASKGAKKRTRATCRPTDVAYALLLGHLQGLRGEPLFDTVWTHTLDQPKPHLHDLAAMAARSGMIDYRHAGSVIEVGFDHLLRPVDGQLL